MSNSKNLEEIFSDIISVKRKTNTELVFAFDEVEKCIRLGQRKGVEK